MRDLTALWFVFCLDAAFVVAKVTGVEPAASWPWSVALVPVVFVVVLFVVLWLIVAAAAVHGEWWK